MTCSRLYDNDYQETWALKNQVCRLNQHFDDYNSCGVSGICDDVLLKGRPYGGVSFLIKKSISPYFEACKLNRKTSVLYQTKFEY